MKRALLVVVAAAVLAPAADAKMCVKIATVPAHPIAGEPTTIRVSALAIVVGGGRARPGDQAVRLTPQTRLNIRITPERGQPRMIRVERAPDSDTVLQGRFTFPHAGLWTLSWAAWPKGSNPACAGERRVRVR